MSKAKSESVPNYGIKEEQNYNGVILKRVIRIDDMQNVVDIDQYPIWNPLGNRNIMQECYEDVKEQRRRNHGFKAGSLRSEVSRIEKQIKIGEIIESEAWLLGFYYELENFKKLTVQEYSVNHYDGGIRRLVASKTHPYFQDHIHPFGKSNVAEFLGYCGNQQDMNEEYKKAKQNYETKYGVIKNDQDEVGAIVDIEGGVQFLERKIDPTKAMLLATYYEKENAQILSEHYAAYMVEVGCQIVENENGTRSLKVNGELESLEKLDMKHQISAIDQLGNVELVKNIKNQYYQAAQESLEIIGQSSSSYPIKIHAKAIEDKVKSGERITVIDANFLFAYLQKQNLSLLNEMQNPKTKKTWKPKSEINSELEIEKNRVEETKLYSVYNRKTFVKNPAAQKVGFNPKVEVHDHGNGG